MISEKEIKEVIKKDRSMFVFSNFAGKVKLRFRFMQATGQQIMKSEDFIKMKDYKCFFNQEPISIN